jgi:hypothetical protein
MLLYLNFTKRMNIETLNQFESHLMQSLLQVCSSACLLQGTLLATDDLTDLWNDVYAPEYMVDAVPQVAAYPNVSVAWAAYLGMAAAQGWDADWERCRRTPYSAYHGARGFDDMDDHIVRDLLGLPLEGEEARRLTDTLRSCAELVVTMIRNEQIEPQSPEAFHVFARSCRAMYRIGVAIELRRLGYHMERLN